MDLYGVYIVMNMSSETQQNIIIRHNREQGRTNVIIRTRVHRRFKVEMQFGINMSTYPRFCLGEGIEKLGWESRMPLPNLN